MGTSSGGALTELIALGAADAYLTLGASLTLWRFRYRKHTNFALESVRQAFNSQVAFGTEAQMTLNRTGDLAHWQYVVMEIPGIKAVEVPRGHTSPYPSCSTCDACGDAAHLEADCCAGEPAPLCEESESVAGGGCDGLGGGHWAHWVNAIGYAAIQRVCMSIGGQVIDAHTGDYLYMWEELAGLPGKRLEEMIGKRRTRPQLIRDSKKDRTMYAPLWFWYNKVSGNALPLVSLQFHGVQYNVAFAPLHKLIQVSDAQTTVIKVSDCQPLTNNDLQAVLETTYVYLDVEERDKFATGSFSQVVTQVQTFHQTGKGRSLKALLNFNHPITSLIFSVRRKCNEVCNNTFNFSGINGEDPIASSHLRLNGQARYTPRKGQWFRLVQPYQSFNLIPESYTYAYSFAVDATDDGQPSGSCNFSRIDNIEWLAELQEGLKDEEVTTQIYGRGWNVVKYREGLAGLTFSS
jgi:hypothetical protein